jgi:Uncharacterized protein conserved in bacteria
MKSSTKDQVEGTLHEVKGKAKEVAGKLTDNPKLEGEGTGEKIAGQVQEKSARSRRFSGNRWSGGSSTGYIGNSEAKNEKVAYWNNAIGLCADISCSHDGRSKCRCQHLSAPPDRVCLTSRDGSDTRDVCLCRP